VISAALRRVAQKLRLGTARLRWHGAPAAFAAFTPWLPRPMPTRTLLVRTRPAHPRHRRSLRGSSRPAGAGRGRQPRRVVAATAGPTGHALAHAAALSSLLARAAQALAAQAVPRTVFWTDRWSPA
jgi:hypothetical protein